MPGIVSSPVSLGQAELGKLHLVNVHNEELTDLDRSVFKAWITPKLIEAEAHPERCAVFLTGDLNQISFNPIGFSLQQAARVELKASYAHKPRFWQETLSCMLELEGNDFTHYKPDTSHLNVLTRVFLTMPTWMCKFHSFNVSASDPVAMFQKRLSDHSVVRIEVAPAGGGGAPSRIPASVCASKEFKTVMSRLLSVVELRDLAAAQRWEAHKTLLLESARVVDRKSVV